MFSNTGFIRLSTRAHLQKKVEVVVQYCCGIYKQILSLDVVVITEGFFPFLVLSLNRVESNY